MYYIKVFISGKNLSIRDVIEVAKNNEKVVLSKSSLKKIKKSHIFVKSLVENNKAIYGITTGFGALHNISIPKKQIAQLQINIVKSHSASVGKPFSKEITRAAVLLRANTLAKGHSGVKVETVMALIALLNKQIHPIIPEKGSVGASGDLSPLAHIALVLIGKGKAEFRGKIFSGKIALKKAGLKPLNLNAKEGLALVNGTQVMSAIGCLAISKAEQLVKNADIAAAMSAEVLKSKNDWFQKELHELRPFKGQGDSASLIGKLVKGSKLIKSANSQTQDPYSIRCAPQVHGAVRDTIEFAKKIFETEINSCTDNPIIFPESKKVLCGGNFHGEYLAFALDFLAIALSELANISERRIFRLTDSKLSNLPPFLVKNSGLNSGFMIAQYTAAALVSENKVLSHPASVDSIPTSANQEDHVSMGSISANKLLQVLFNVQNVLAIEYLCAAQALDFTKEEPGKGTKKAYDAIRKKIKLMEKDRELFEDIKKAFELIEEEKISSAVGY